MNLPHKAETAESMREWSIVTEGPRFYLVHWTSCECFSPANALWLTFKRAYLYVEAVDFQTGQATRIVLPIGLWKSEQEVSLTVSSRRSLEKWIDADREVLATLVNDAEKMRAGLRTDPRIERPSGLIDPRGQRARS